MADIKNYRPINLLPIIYKVFSYILLQRMLHTLDQHQPREQAGFRPGYSTSDHLQTVSQPLEKANEYNIPLCLAFVDYEKAFDSIEFAPLLTALENRGVDPAYIGLICDLNGATATLKLHQDSDKIKLERGAREGDNNHLDCSQPVSRMQSSTRSTGRSVASISMESVLPISNSLMISSWWHTHLRNWSRC